MRIGDDKNFLGAINSTNKRDWIVELLLVNGTSLQSLADVVS